MSEHETLFFFLLQINTKVTALNLKGNDLSKDGIRYVTRMMAENDSINELVSPVFAIINIEI